MKRKFLLSLVLIIILGFFCASNVFAEIDPFMNTVLTEMDTSKVGITGDTTFTKFVRTIYAIVQMVVIGGSIGYFTWHSKQFFSSDMSVRSKAKEMLPYRVLALTLIIAVDGIVTIIAKYLGA